LLNAGKHDVPAALKWELGYSKDSRMSPSAWIPATAPGAVQLDIAKAESYQPFYFAEHWKDYLWMEDMWYTYRTSFLKPDLAEGMQLHFVSLGIDYEFDIILNNEKIFHQEGMFTPVDIDLTGKLKDKNQLQVRISPVPKLHPLPADRTQAAQVLKPAVSYGWDWHPRLVPLGIWDSTYLEIRPESHIDDFHVSYKLSEDLDEAALMLGIGGKALKDRQYKWILTDASGKEVLRSEDRFGTDPLCKKLTLKKPVMWWPHDHGTPYLYNSELLLTDQSGTVLQKIRSKIGFRRVRLVMNEGAWDEPRGFPKTRSVPPAQMEINGRRIFLKGTNWVSPEVFPGTFTRERYNELLNLAKEANFNFLRVWGGGPVNKESFFELCDEKGLMVWQEFPLACNNYEGTPHYLAILQQESASIIKRLRSHPSLVIWCGGNELFNNWSMMTDQSAALRLLNSQTFLLDPDTPFNPTSPVMGMGHGHYVFRDQDTHEEVFQEMVRSKFTAYTEFGMPAPASVDILKKIIPENELWPPKAGSSWESHHAYNAWIGNTWLCQDIIESYFGISGSLDQLVANGQLLQCEGYKCIYEEARRQKPYCSMAANWCYNEPWPTAANNSIISYPAVPKPGYYAVREACRPLLASARIPRFGWKAGDNFSTEIWMLNDLPVEVQPGKVTVSLACGNAKIRIMEWQYMAMKAGVNNQGPTVRYTLPSWKEDRFRLILEVENHPELNSEYTLAFRPGE
jgi:beta-mannosidase